MEKKFSVFAQNLAYYNEGELVGGWIDLPQSPDKIDEYLKNVLKIDDEHEEYEIADVDEVPFPYPSIQWSDLKDINNLAIIYNSLSKSEKEAISGYLEVSGEEYYSVDELINLCLQADSINYWEYSFEGIEYNQDCSSNLKMGYTMAEETGLYYELQKLGVLDYFDFEKYGESYSYSHELLENGYLIYDDCNIDLNMYSKDEITEQVQELLNLSLDREKEEIQIEV